MLVKFISQHAFSFVFKTLINTYLHRMMKSDYVFLNLVTYSTYMFQVIQGIS